MFGRHRASINFQAGRQHRHLVGALRIAIEARIAPRLCKHSACRDVLRRPNACPHSARRSWHCIGMRRGPSGRMRRAAHARQLRLRLSTDAPRWRSMVRMSNCPTTPQRGSATPRPPGADRGTDGRREQRLGTACAACVPEVDEARGGAVLGALERCGRPYPRKGGNVFRGADRAFAWATHDGSVGGRRDFRQGASNCGAVIRAHHTLTPFVPAQRAGADHED